MSLARNLTHKPGLKIGRNLGRKPPRQGIVILVVVSLLVLLSLIALTFGIAASQYRRHAQATAKQKRRGPEPRIELEEALYQLLRDTDVRVRSSIAGHSLLRDLYGVDGVIGEIQSVLAPNPPSNSANSGPDQFLTFITMPNANLNVRDDFYNGVVLTILDGPAQGFSTRIVNYIAPTAVGGSATISVEMLHSDRNNFLLTQVSELQRNNPRFLINGRTFNGTGFGYIPYTQANAVVNYDPNSDTSPGNLNLQFQGDPVALLPHFVAYAAGLEVNSPDYSMQGGPGPAPTRVDAGGADESYDAVDFQNMFLAKVPPGVTGSGQIVPSFHRTALIRYWWSILEAAASPNPPDPLMSRDALRRVIMRPMPWDHPQFSGSNPAFDIQIPASTQGMSRAQEIINNLTTGSIAWDVDNDGDGIPDSIWIDLGMPVKTAANGRRFKPLFAFLVKDMDGRINLNAHGNVEQLRTADYAFWSPGADGQPGRGGVDDDNNGNPDDLSELGWPGTDDRLLLAPVGPPTGALYAGNANNITLPRGPGGGPAEINPGPATGIETRRIYQGWGAIAGRYGQDGFGLLPGGAVTALPAVIPGPRPGRSNNNDDPLTMLSAAGTPNDYANQFSRFASPPDGRGIGTIASDFAGNPLTKWMGTPAGEVIDEPYEILLNNTLVGDAGGSDAPFTYGELERLLRWNDHDAPSLPNRLILLAPNSFHNPADISGTESRRALVTTESRHIPVPNTLYPRELFTNQTSRSLIGATAQRVSPTIGDIFAAKIQTWRLSNMLTPLTNAELATQIEIMLPLEVRRGQLFNINRFFGNGRDDNGNFVVDEPGENEARFWQGAGLPTEPPNYHNNDRINATNNAYGGRHIFMRNLYCMMMFLVDAGFQHPALEPGITGPERRELTAHRIAQWVANVVDFSDPDAIMTPFEYDLNPLDGWQLNIDGDPSTVEAAAPPLNPGDPPPPNQRRVTWGCEFPDLMLSETTAFHDRRVADTNNDTNEREFRQDAAGMPGDNDLDQLRIPQGSLFLELYCPRNRQFINNRFPVELYYQDPNDSQWKLDLGRVAPQSIDGLRYPVWRVVISERTDNSDMSADNDSPRFRSQETVANGGRPDTTTFEPSNMNLLNALNPALQSREQLDTERVVWFAPLDPGTPDSTAPNNRANFTFYGRSGRMINTGAAPTQPLLSNLGLQPGSYAVVGPRAQTRIGSADDLDPVTFYDPSPHLITMPPFGPPADNLRSFSVTNNDGANTYPTIGSQIRRPLGIIAAAKSPAAPLANEWMRPEFVDPANGVGVGVSISEPLPQQDLDGDTNGEYYKEPEFIHDVAIGLPDGYDEADASARFNTVPDEPYDSRNNRPLKEEDALETGTYNDFKSAFLQRLANPLIPHHPLANPYVTVDWAPIDLTVFNGEDRETARYMLMDPWDPDDPDPYGMGSPDERFTGRERGDRTREPMVGPPAINWWSPETVIPRETNPSGPTENHFRHNLVHTLGYLNFSFAAQPLSSPPAPLQYLGDAPHPPDPAFPNDVGPKPMLTWNNRPYANPLELLLVPSSTQGRLLHEFGTATGADPYATTTMATDPASFRAPYNHLLNFLQTATNPGTNRAGHFYRLLDFVETPSPFVGTQKWFNAQTFSSAPTPSAADGFRPPYNYLSRFRDPGRVNINTVFDSRIWEAIAKAFPTMDPAVDPNFWNNTLRNALGVPNGLPPMNRPTAITNPLRSAASADLAPRLHPSTGNQNALRWQGVDATLLRRPSSGGRDPLFSFTSRGGMPPTAGPGSQVVRGAFNNTDRNAFQRYQGMARLSNLLTSHSNVYAVWITVGYFEVLPIPRNDPSYNSAAHSDGYALGQELGSETGNIRRHRAFYMIDRSIPVAFEPGENHNVDRAVVLRRFIE